MLKKQNKKRILPTVVLMFFLLSLVPTQKAFAAAAPTISGISASSGPGGTNVTITGTNFTDGGLGTGGTITTSGLYTIHTFNSNGTFTVPTGRNVEVLVVGGGGGSKEATAYQGHGGGGGGGVISTTAYSLSSGPHVITVGKGGDKTNGENSVFESLIAIGGGYGGTAATVGSGGSGGGGGSQPPYTGGSGTTGQGYNGGTGDNAAAAGGGGGGASAVGANFAGTAAGNGGAGVSSSITGSAVVYGGGGGGGKHGSGTAGAGGNGGGGNGALNTNGSNGTANRGGGGGGAGATGVVTSLGGIGGSGVVIVRYLTPATATGPTVTIGGVAATNIVVVNSTTITATTAAHSVGAVDVVVTNPDSQSATLAGGYTYTAPTISLLSPNNGVTAGGTAVTITGTGFVSNALATGGTVLTSGDYTIHKFTGNGTFSVPSARDVEVLVVGGGGGGSGGLGGGGGGGGVIKIPSVNVASGDYSIVVGNGGPGSLYSATSTNGGDSTVFGATAKGGGGSGPYSDRAGVAGGCGGGASAAQSGGAAGGAATGSSLGSNVGTIYGNRGGNALTARLLDPTRAAGGGGAGGPGVDTDCNVLGYLAGATGNTGTMGQGAGGRGIESSILGTSYYWGGGGGGGAYTNQYGGYGGIGGGGGGVGSAGKGVGGGYALNSGATGAVVGGAGGANTGGGGGGANWQNTTGGAGGSGIVVVRYKTASSYVTFDGVPATNVVVVNSTTITATIPAHAAGAVDVVVTSGGQTATSSNGFTYGGPTIASITAAHGIITGGTNVTITGTNFLDGGNATGGTITYSGGYTIHTFTTTDTFVAPTNRQVEVLVVGGGGGGAGTASAAGSGAGGGAGGVRYNASYSVTGGVVMPIVVGPAGWGGASGGNNGYKGNDSSFGTITSTGGGYGGKGRDQVGGPGGSGGGGGYSDNTIRAGGNGNTPSTSPSQGNNGGAGGVGNPYGAGGGGGAGAVGGSGHGGAGGAGVAYSISGTSLYYGGGGGGGCEAAAAGIGGSSIGGAGGRNAAGSNASGSRGGGGGGAGGVGAFVGGNGGSGVVIVRYKTSLGNVTFDGVAATNVVVVNSTTITATTPAHSAGAVDVVVTNYDGQTATLSSGFTYVPLPTITPSLASKVGGDAITISGSYFTGSPTITLGGVAATSVNRVDANTITAVTPAHASGYVDAVITNGDGEVMTLTNGFIFTELAPTISSISPTSGLSVGYIDVTITGTNFYALEMATDSYTRGLWHFNETSGSSVADSSGNSVTGTATGTTIIDGYLSKARSFNGTTDYVSLGNPAALQITGSQTIEMWLYPTDMTARRNPYAKAYGGEGTITQEMNGVLACYYGTSGINGGTYQGLNSIVAIPINQWSHVACVRDFTNSKLSWYINGVKTSEVTTLYSAAVASSETAYIGKGYVSNYAGKIDEVRISNYARSAAEIARSASRITFDGVATTNNRVVNSTTITATTPAHSAGAVNVTVTNPDSQTSILSNGYTYNPPTVSSISPNSGTTNGATGITVTGTDFKSANSSYYRLVTVPYSGTTLTNYQVLITLDTAALVTASKMNSDGRDIRVVDFDTNAPLSFWVETGTINTTTTRIFVKIPSLATGGKKFYLGYGRLTNTSLSSGANTFDYFVQNGAGSYTPTSLNYIVEGQITGANDWRINAYVNGGTYYQLLMPWEGGDTRIDRFPGPTTLLNGGTKYTTYKYRATIYRDTTNHFIIYNKDNATTILNLANNDIVPTVGNTLSFGSTTWSFVRKYNGLYDLSAAIGTETVDYSGVTLGGTAATGVVSSSATSITGTTPAYAAGAVDVVVTNIDGVVGTLSNGYSYFSPPTFTSVTPSTAHTPGGDIVTISGANFYGTPTVTFGVTAGTSVNVVDTNTITVVTPAKTVGTYNVVITNPDGQAVTATNAITYTELPPVISSISPNVGAAAGGTNVTISGTNFYTGSLGTGGTVTTDGLYTLHTFISSSTFSLPINVTRSVEVLVVAGGGGGGSGGGGAGGLIYNSSYAVTGGTPVTVTVGNGGNGGSAGTIGSNSVFGSLTAIGGGAGGSHRTDNATTGGSGGGGGTDGSSYTIKSGTTGQGTAGGKSDRGSYGGGGAGGGAGSAGANATTETDSIGRGGNGGGGLQYSQFASVGGSPSGWFAGGGGGGANTNGANATDGGIGGNGGGGNGTRANSGNGSAATANTGGGGGGRDPEGTTGGNGGTGIVIVRYLTPTQVTIGGNNLVSPVSTTGYSITGVTPAHLSGLVDVVVTNPDGQTSTLTNGFTYFTSRFEITSSALNQREGVGGMVTVQAQDVNGDEAIVASDTTLTLSSSSSAGFFARDLNESESTRWNYTTVVIPTGQSQVSFYYKDNQKGTPTITVSGPEGQGALSATQEETITSKYRFLVTGITNPIQSGVPSFMTIQAVDVNGSPLSDYTGTVHFTTTDEMGHVPADFVVTSSMLGNYTFVNGVTFVTEGTWCVTATDVSDANITGSQCSIGVTPAGSGIPTHLQIVTDPQFIAADGMSSPITVQLQDVDNNPAGLVSSQSVYVYSDSGTAEVSIDGVNFSDVPFSTIIAPGLTSINLYFKDPTVGTHSFTVADDAVAGEDFGLINDTQIETTGVGDAYQLAFLQTAPETTAGQSSGAVSVVMQDNYGNIVSSTINRHLFVIPSAGTVATTSNGVWGSYAQLDFVVGQSVANVYYKNNTAGTYDVVVSDTYPADGATGLLDATVSVAVNSALPAKIDINSAEQELVAGAVSEPIAVRLLDQYDNPTTTISDTTIYLTTNQSGSHFSLNSNFVAETTSLVIPANNNSANIYFKQTGYAATVAVTVSDNASEPDGAVGLSDDSQIETINAGSITSFAFSSAPTTATAGVTPAAFVLVARNSNGVSIPFTSMRVYLRSDSTGTPVWATTADMATPITYLDLGIGDMSANLYYQDTKAGTMHLIVSDEVSGSDTGVTNATGTLVVSAEAPSLLTYTSSVQSLVAGQASAQITFKLEDSYHNQSAATTSTIVSLATSTGTGAFASTAGGTYNLTSVTVAQGASTGGFYYKDTAAGAPQITISKSGFSSASQTETIGWGTGQAIHLALGDTTIPVGTDSDPITITVTNQYSISIPLDEAWIFTLSSSHAPTGTFNSLSQSSFTYSDTLAGSVTLTAAKSGLTSGTLNITEQAGVASQIVFTTAEQTIEIGEKSETISIAARDEYDNAVGLGGDLTVDLGTSSENGIFKNTSNNTATQVTLPAAAPSASFFYQDTTVAIPTLTVSGGGIGGSQDISVIAGQARGLHLSSTPTTLPANQVSNAVLLETFNAYGQSVSPVEDLAVNLSANDGHGVFALTPSTSFDVTSLMVPAGEFSLPFYFKDATTGGVTIQSLLPKEQIVTVVNTNSSDLYEYPVSFNINTANLVSSGLMNADGRDIRFTDKDGSTNLPYWIESGMNTASTSLWVKIPYLARNSNHLVFLSYGVAERTAESSQSGIFPYMTAYPTFTDWSNSSSTSTCGAVNMLGGYNRFGAGAATQRTYANLPAGRYQISFNYYQLDSWDGELGRLYVNNSLVWSRQYNQSGSNVCGGYWGDAGLYYPVVTVNVTHAGGDMVLQFNSTLNQVATDESWGVDNITVQPLASPAPTLSVSTEADTLDFVITAGLPYRLAVTGASSLSADSTGNAYSVQILDAYGNVTTLPSDAVMNLTSTATGSGEFAGSLSWPWGIDHLDLSTGASGATVYYRDSATGNKTLTTSMTDLVSAEQAVNVVAGAITRLNFISESQTFAILAVSAPFQLQALDQHDNVVTPSSSFALNFSSTNESAEFSVASDSWQAITTINWPNSSDTASFYYKSGTVGTDTISVASVYPTITQNVTLISNGLSALEFSSEPQTVVVDTPSSLVTVTLVDGAGNPAPDNSPLSVTLSSSAETTEFTESLTDPDWQSGLTITVPAGHDNFTFYFRDSSAGTITVTAAADGLDSATQEALIVTGVADHLALNITNSTLAGTILQATVQVMTADNLPVAVQGDTTVNITSSPTGDFSLLSGDWQNISSLTLLAGQSGKTIYWRSEVAGSMDLAASVSPAESWTDATATVNVLPNSIYQIKVLSGTESLNIHDVSAAFYAQTQDMYGNVVVVSSEVANGGDSVPVYLYGTGQFATELSGDWNTTQIALGVGESTISFYYRGNTLGAETLTVSDQASEPVVDTGWVDGTWDITVIGDVAASVVFTTPARTKAAGQYGQITIAAIRGDESPAVLENSLNISLSALGSFGTYSLSDTEPEPITTVTIPRGSSSITFYARNTLVGNYTINATASGYPMISQSFTVVPGAADIINIISTNITVVAGAESGPLHWQVQDHYGNATVTTTTVTTQLEITDGGELSQSSGENWSAITSFQLSPGATDGYLYYRNVGIAGEYEISLDTQFYGLGRVMQTVFVTAAPVNKIVIGSTPFNIVKGNVSPVVSILFTDEYGNSQVLATPTTLYFYTSGQGSFSTTANFAATVSSRLVSAGQGGTSIYYKATAAGAPVITVSDKATLDNPDTDWGNATQTESVSEGHATGFVLTGPDSVSAGGSIAMTLSVNNEYDLPYINTEPIDVYLNSSSLYGRFSSTTNFTPSDYLTSVTINEGIPHIVYYRDTLAGAAQITIADVTPIDDPDQGILNASHSVSVLSADIYSLSFVTVGQSLEAGQVSDQLAVQARDSFGNVKVVVADTPVYLYSSSNGASFSSADTMTPAITSATILSGQSGATFYYQDTVSGTSTITVSDQSSLDNPDIGLVNAVQTATITAGNIFRIKMQSEAQTLEVGQISAELTVQLQNRYDVARPANNETTLYLTSSSNNGQFSVSEGGPYNVTTLTIPAGQSDASFYYRQITAGSATIRVSDASPADGAAGWIDASLSATVSAGNTSQIIITSSPSEVVAYHNSTAISVMLKNSSGYETALAENTRFYVRSSAEGGLYEFATALSGPWGINYFDLASGNSQFAIYYRSHQLGEQTLTISDEIPITPGVGMTNATTTITVNEQTIDYFTVTNIADPQIQGAPSSVVVMARDSAAFIYPQYNGEICFSSSDSDAVLPSCYTFLPADHGIISFQNSVAFLSIGEKSVTADDGLGHSGTQSNITVLSNHSGALAKVKFSNILTDSITLSNGLSYGPIAVQLFDATDQSVNAAYGGYNVRLSSGSAVGRFSLSSNGPWTSTLVATIPAHLSSINVYYKDEASGTSFITASDWAGGVDDAQITNASLETVSSGLTIDYTKTLSSPDAATGALTANNVFFANDYAATSLTGTASVSLTVINDATGLPVPADLHFIVYNAAGEIYTETTTTTVDNGTYTYNPSAFVANLPADVGNWSILVSAESAAGVLGAESIPMTVSAWKGNLSYELRSIRLDSALSVEASIYENGTLTTPSDFTIFWVDSQGASVAGSPELAKADMTETSTGHFVGNLSTETGLENGGTYHAIVKVLDADNSTLAEDAHGDIQIANNPAAAPKNFVVEKVISSTPPATEAYDLQFIWDSAANASSYAIYRTQDKFARIYADPCTIADVRSGARAQGDCDSVIDLDVDASDDATHWVRQATVEQGTSYTLSNANALAGKDYFFMVRASNGDEESALSSLVFVSKHPFVAHDVNVATNFNWLSLPYNLVAFTNSAAEMLQSVLTAPSLIVKDIEGGLGDGKNQKITAIGLWDALTQQIADVYQYNAATLHQWTGTDFSFAPGNGVYVETANNASNFDWTIVGADEVVPHEFTYLSSLGMTNYNWIALPYSGMYSHASDIVNDLEGNTGLDSNQKINVLALWDAETQNISAIYRYRGIPFRKWTGLDFEIKPGDGVYIQTSGGAGNFSWTPVLLVEPNK